MFQLFKKKRDFSKNTIHPVVLLVLDGWGIAPHSLGNAIAQAKKPVISRLFATYPTTQLSASGESVGLPAGEEGNSEVGHLTISAGRMILQSLPRINRAIENRSFFDNPAFDQARMHTRTHQSRLHIMGLIGTGGVHASNAHLDALLEWCQEKNMSNVVLHLFTDGRDSPPQKAVELIDHIEKQLVELRFGTIGSVTGRYYAMDRDNRWERTEKTYHALVHGVGKTAPSATVAVQNAYAAKQTDEFIEPTVIVRTSAQNPNQSLPVGTISDNDAVIFFNFRIDRPRQLTMAFTMPDFEHLKKFKLDFDPHAHKYGGSAEQHVLSGNTFDRGKRPQNLFFVTMTEYQRGLPVSAVAYPPTPIADTLAEQIAKRNLLQVRIAESEKERMVTFYFNGLREEAFPNTDVVIVPSPHVKTYDKQIEMNLPGIVDAFYDALEKDHYQFFAINFANADMVAHSGNLAATIRAIEKIDVTVGNLAEALLSCNGTFIITADHGNAEQVASYKTQGFFYTTQKGTVNTSHSSNPVPFMVVARDVVGKQLRNGGTLRDIAPTVLARLGIPTPHAMTGKDLFVL